MPGYPTAIAGSAASPATIDYRQQFTFSGVLRDSRDGSPLVNQPVALQTRTAGTSTWKTATTLLSGNSGELSYDQLDLAFNTEARWVFAGAGYFAAATGPATKISARPSLNLCCGDTITLGKSRTMNLFLGPKATALKIRLQQYVDKKWKEIASCTTSKGICKLTVKPKKTGTYTYRAYRPADTLLIAGTSSSEKIKVVKK